MSGVENHWGPNEVMAVAAVRYCLNRQTYIVEECCDWIRAMWPHWRPETRAAVKRDITREIARDDVARESGSDYLPLGADCDRAAWVEVAKLWQP